VATKKIILLISVIVIVALVCTVSAYVIYINNSSVTYQNQNTITILRHVHMTCGKTVLTNNTVINWGTLPFSEGFTLHKYIKITNTLQNASVYLNLNVTGLPNDWSETRNLSFAIILIEFYPINITSSSQPILIRLFPNYYNLSANSTVVAAKVCGFQPMLSVRIIGLVQYKYLQPHQKTEFAGLKEVCKMHALKYGLARALQESKFESTNPVHNDPLVSACTDNKGTTCAP